MSDIDLASFKKISVDQMNQTQKKIRNNILSMLDFLDRCLGQPDKPNQEMSEIHINEIIQNTTLSAAKVQSTLMQLELKNLIFSAPNLCYSSKI